VRGGGKKFTKGDIKKVYFVGGFLSTWAFFFVRTQADVFV